MPPVIDTHIPPLVNTASAAEILGVSRAWVQKLYRTGRLPCRPVGEDTSGGKRRYRHILFLKKTITRYAKHGLPPLEPSNAPVIDEAIPELLRTTDVAARLGVPRATVNQLWRTGRLAGRPVPDYDGRTDTVVFRPEEIERALAERGQVVRTQWAPAKP
jgi:predicted site-specific integrase-resolvase